MLVEEHVQQAAALYPALKEVMLSLDAPSRGSIMHAITLAIHEAQHEERRVCALIALREAEGATNGPCATVIERIAATILGRDIDA